MTREWYNQHRDHPSTGFRNQDRLSAEQESHLREGSVLDKNLRKVHSAPSDLTRRLPPPPRNNRYVSIGGHIGLIDNNYNVKADHSPHDNH